MGWIVGWALLAGLAVSGGSSLMGDWMTPGGSIVRVAACGEAVCLAVVKVSPTAKGTKDANNPDKALQERPICGLTIGEGFHPVSDTAAEGGKLYDPESGKTYSGKMERKGSELRLRGFVGVSLFGRTETWKKVETIEPCH